MEEGTLDVTLEGCIGGLGSLLQRGVTDLEAGGLSLRY